VSGALARQRALGRRLLDVLNRRDRVQAELDRLRERLAALHAEQDAIERALTAADEDAS
jgi:hypothetical protein